MSDQPEKKMSTDGRVENATHCMKLLRDKNIEALGEEEVPPRTAFDRALEILVKLYATRSDVAPPVTHLDNDSVVVRWRDVSVWVGGEDGFGVWNRVAHPFTATSDIVAQLSALTLERESA